jgi:tRNA-splicing ligase RtcB
MNRRQLEKLGVPPNCVGPAIEAVQRITRSGTKGAILKNLLRQVAADPEAFLENQDVAGLAAALIEARSFVPPEPIPYRTWGEAGIDANSHAQMKQACALPVARAAALMPDAHVGYGLPIGGVLACQNAVIPYAVGVDIACRMKLSVLDLPPTSLDGRFDRYRSALERGTRFGVGVQHEKRQTHDVMDRDWSITRVTRQRKDKAWKQLGTSGSGNHFVEFGVLTVDTRQDALNLDAGTYVALLSHSGSRGVGASVCSTYSAIARARLPKRYAEAARLAWLDLDTQAGGEYWAAMNLMGDYASANHDVIHRLLTKLLGARCLAGVENHHNFAWKETHGDRELIVHRKGATPASAGTLGVIPGTMADPAYVVRGKGEPDSLHSAAHGAGRVMSRRKARDNYTWSAERKALLAQGVHVLSAGADEVPAVYKDIRQVMAQQSDLVEIIARFDPRIVKMCGDGSRAED